MVEPAQSDAEAGWATVPREDIVARLQRGELSSASLTEAYLARIDRYDGAVGAFYTVSAQDAREQAALADQALDGGAPLGPLHGLPVGIKDNIDTAGLRTTIGSEFFAQRVPTHDAEVIRRLRAAGAVVLGKLALHEFAYGGTSQNAHHRDCRNPWDLTRIPGGSSGGSGAALASDLCAAALGSDTGGSVRSPAALNGVTAMRPTRGRVSNRGVFPITWSFDTVGPMARSARDVAALLDVLSGFDPDDPGSVEHQSPARDGARRGDLTGVQFGLPSSFYYEEVDAEIVSLVHQAASVMSSLGCVVDEVDIPGAEDAEQAARRIIWAEALAIHEERLATNPERFGEDIRRRLASGHEVSGPDYARYVQTGREWRRRLEGVFERFDFLLVPTSGRVAPRAAESETIETTRLMTRLTYGWTLAGLPVLALPCGFSSAGLPVGLQLVGRPWAESDLLAVGSCFQQETTWHVRTPPLEAGLAAIAAKA